MSSIVRRIFPVKDLIALSGTCTNWRKIALEEKGHLSTVRFSIEHTKPFRKNWSKFQAVHCEQLPAIFSQVGSAS